MADISVQCPACGNQFRVSEYVDQEKLVCAKCGAAITAPPQAEVKLTSAPKLRLAPAKPAEHVVQSPSAETNITQAWMQRRQQHARRASMSRHVSILTRISSSLWFCWGIFVILAGVGIYLRFFAPLSIGIQAEMRFWGAMAVLACHVTVVLSAFSDDTFQGMLCLLIPGYTLYYLFVVSSEFLLRAVVAALLIAFGLDAWQYLSTFATDVFDGINRWMKAGGDTTNRHISGP